MTRDEAQALVDSVPHWYHQFEIFPGITTPGDYDPSTTWDMLCLPDDLTGVRAIDIGASDGFYSLNLKRRGADVLSVDYRPKNGHGFAVMERLSGFDFDYRQANVFDLSPRDLGTFDVVLFLGVLYHLPDMLRGLSIVRQLCRGKALVESSVLPERRIGGGL